MASNIIFEMIISSASKMERERAEEVMWEFITNYNHSFKWHGDSELLDIKTRIAEYTNSKGHKSLSHFTANGKYYGSVNKYGYEPEYYEGTFKVSRMLFMIDLDKTFETNTFVFTPKTKGDFLAEATKKAGLSGVIAARKAETTARKERKEKVHKKKKQMDEKTKAKKEELLQDLTASYTPL
jgi:hypothetical protein